MNTEDDFLIAIDAAPDDAALRLVYADWLEEHGRGGAAAHERMEAKYGQFEETALRRIGHRKWRLKLSSRPGHASWKEHRHRQWRRG
ncbi:hypothetical protein AYO44_02770 [Planctomycetaceae bacterium SCGC AG-212-F19]|nr:hypothetical protein AYO44_02770 [Planctomycetaceae bacterium SCGC AG-212-F19]